HAQPPTGKRLELGSGVGGLGRGSRESDVRIPRFQTSTVITENSQRSPLAGQDQLRITVAVQVAPDSAADESNTFQHAAVLHLELPALSFVAVNMRRRGFGVTPWDHAGASEQFQSPIGVDVGQG